MPDAKTKIVILGAGAIGCYIGAAWQLCGLDVTLLARPATAAAITQHGVTLSGGQAARIAPGNIAVTPDASILTQADLIVVTVKSTALGQVIDDIRKFAQPGTPVLCLLNGVSPLATLRAALPDHPVLAGMVPFNVVWTPPSQFRRSSIGSIKTDRHALLETISSATKSCHAPIEQCEDMQAIQYGKLLLNLNNPINALSGLTLYDQIRQRPYRRVFAAALSEALTVLKTARIKPAKVGAASPALGVILLKSPDFLFNSIVIRVQKIEQGSLTSMAVDLAAGRKTEVDTINGDIVRLAAQFGQTAPVNATLVRLVHEAETGGKRQFSGPDLALATGVT